ncbi:hypothetical protein [Caulobacter sp. RL271]|uniref:Integral membrane protein n=1 Tax=Caulobacter segnis TaxID=88688 RepID=A0ABY4ZTT6_9CAUL|nr:hypothetical protein [Caulobacter segnis]USQ95920.1 hypothetical protein MZV50_25855 [Caulobacter segnis]
MLYLVLDYALYVVAFTVCGVALWLGDRPLKVTAFAVMFFWGISPLTRTGAYVPWNLPLTIVDSNAFLVLTWISLRWRRVWSAMIAGLALVMVVTPFVGMADQELDPYFKVFAYNILGYILVVELIVAIWLTVRARRQADEGAVRP